MDRINQLLQQLVEADQSNQDLVDDLTDMIYMLGKAKDPYTRDLIKQNIREINRKLQEKNLLPERKLSKKEIKTRDKYADDLPDKEFKKRYGKDWESVKYATATKMAKKKNEAVEQSLMDQWLAEKADPCWKGYEMIGMKKKGGKDVPNCVPKKGKKNS